MGRPPSKPSRIGVLAVVAGLALAGCGSSGGDTNSSGTAAKPSRGFNSSGFNVNVALTVHAPKGTKLTFERTNNGNCAKGITNHAWTTGEPPWNPGIVYLFTGTVDGSCAFERSSQQFKVTANYPDGSSRFRLVNVEQTGSGHVALRRMETVCAWGTLRCVGGSESRATNDPHWLAPPLNIG